MEGTSFTTPTILREPQDPLRLQRISFEGGTNGFHEKWLQESLFKHPEVLPCSEIDPAFRVLVPVCRELNTPAGPLDVLYVTPWGDIAVVETKLWRNAEARRVVVAQVMDYAKEMVKWSYDELEAKVRQANPEISSLYDFVGRCSDALDYSSFHDRIERVLKSGQFLLLIVGDGIREGVTALADFLDRFGTMQFSFGLIEAAVYDVPGIGRLLYPTILAKTVIVKRSVITIKVDGAPVAATAELSDSAECEAPTGEVDERARRLAEFYKSYWTDFLKSVRLSDLSQPKAKPSSSTNIFFPMPPSGAAAWVSAYFAQSKKQVGVYLTFARDFAVVAWPELLAQRTDIDREMGHSPTWEDQGNGKYYISERLAYDSLDDPATLARISEFFETRINAYVTAFRPRLARIAEKM